MTFEEGIKRLEEIVKALDDEKINLEKSIELFEEGVKVAKECMEILGGAKGKITVIKEELDKIIEAPLDENV